MWQYHNKFNEINKNITKKLNNITYMLDKDEILGLNAIIKPTNKKINDDIWKNITKFKNLLIMFFCCENSFWSLNIFLNSIIKFIQV